MSWDVKDLSIGKVSRIYVESIYYYIDDSVFYIWQVSRHCCSWNLALNGLKLHHLTGTVFLPIEAFEFPDWELWSIFRHKTNSFLVCHRKMAL